MLKPKTCVGGGGYVPKRVKHRIQKLANGKWAGYRGTRRVKKFGDERTALRWLSKQRDIGQPREHGVGTFLSYLRGLTDAARKIQREERLFNGFDSEGKTIN